MDFKITIYNFRDGRPFNINEPKLQFSFDDSSPAEIVLTLHLWKHLDTESLDLDVQPNFVRLTMNEKIFQLRLLDEVKTDSCSARRSQTTGTYDHISRLQLILQS